MKIQILSDLHLEFAELEPPQTSDADVVVLAGDIDVGTAGVEWALENFTLPVIYVLGNHEFYHQQRSKLIDEIRAMTAGTSVHLLERDSVNINGVRFLGATLWTDFDVYATPELSMQHCVDIMPDFRVIKEAAWRTFTPADALLDHRLSLAWLGEQLGHTDNSSTVVVTHHGPSRLSIADKFAGDQLTPAFVSNLEAFIENHTIPLWIHGHTHTHFDYEIHGTRIACNPRGYQPYETDTGFNPLLTIEI